MTRVPHTSSTSAVCAIAVAAHLATSHNRAVDVLGVVDVDVTGTTTAVRNFAGRHVERLRCCGFRREVVRTGRVLLDCCLKVLKSGEFGGRKRVGDGGAGRPGYIYLARTADLPETNTLLS